eukprot:s2052_g15.t1
MPPQKLRISATSANHEGEGRGFFLNQRNNLGDHFDHFISGWSCSGRRSARSTSCFTQLVSSFSQLAACVSEWAKSFRP